MHSWPSPDIPRLPGRGLAVRLHDTSSGQVRPVNPGSTVRMYVCGITPYDATHLGHAATYIAFDMLVRVWRDAGHEVLYVQNATDVDDPLLERAEQTGQPWEELAAEQIELFRSDMAWLQVVPPTHYVGAVESIPIIAEFVERLRAAGATYEVDGDIYFPVRADERFGSVSNLDAATMRTLFGERGGDPDRPGKKDPLDPLVWRLERPGEPSWDSPFGRGRPGWHVECSAIALNYLGEMFDINGGGSDLVFPHHEMSASHAHVATGQWPFARTHVHAGMVALDGEKMSKSRGNLEFASRLRADGRDPGAVRLALLDEHYRADREWTPGMLAAAEERLGRWQAAVAVGAGPGATALLGEVRRHLADDLNTPAALAAIDRWAEQTLLRGGPDTDAPRLVRELCDALLGVALSE
jgi:L-cysteine:1D-myo-inositol 2-amino-2-deoxy-alpha-D-glucopyranoside ligase